MKALLINGSPNENGCTRRALGEIEETLKGCGIGTERIWIGRDAIRPCIGCGGCRATKRCVFPDGNVNRALDAISECDALIVGSPVFYASPNGALLAFLDRFFYTGNDFSQKIGASFVSARRAGTTAALDVLNKYFIISGMPVAPSQYWCMVHGQTPEQVEQDEEGLQIMRTLGRNVAWLMQCVEAGRKAGVCPPAIEAPRRRTNFIR